VKVIPGISDHEAVFIESRPMEKKVTSRKVWKYKNANYTSFREDLSLYYDEFQQKTKDNNNIEEIWTLFKDKLQLLMKEHIPQTIKTIKNG
jgi:hypothetical protein